MGRGCSPRGRNRNLPTGVPDPQWYAVNTRARHETKVETGLRRKGLEIFLPRISVLSRRRDRRRWLDTPLFPGYLFVHSDLEDCDYQHIIKEPGAIRILGIRGKFTPVPDETIASIQTLLQSRRPFDPWSKLGPGVKVRVVEGPLAGATGIILRQQKGRRRLVIVLELLQRAIAVNLEEEAVEPCC